MSDSQEEVKSYKEVLTTIRARVMGALKPPARLDVSEWADSHMHLSPEASSEPGIWRTSRAEYQRGMMDAVSDKTVEIGRASCRERV